MQAVYQRQGCAVFHLPIPHHFRADLWGAFGGSEALTFDVGIANQDGSPASEAIVEGLWAITVGEDSDSRNVFNIKEGDLEAERKELEDGNLDAVIVISGGLGSSLESLQPVDIEIYYDLSQTAIAQVLLPMLRQCSMV